MEQLESIATHVAAAIEMAGIGVLVVGGVASVVLFLLAMAKDTHSIPQAYGRLRRNLGHSILLGLEFLVAGDIVSTITIEPTFESVGVLAVIVLVRTFLSFSLEVEITGQWPWEKKGKMSQSQRD